MHSFKRTKIIATLGPSSSTEEIISQLAKSGMDAARLNFSHGSHDSHNRIYRGKTGEKCKRRKTGEKHKNSIGLG